MIGACFVFGVVFGRAICAGALAPKLAPTDLSVVGAERGFLGQRRPVFRWRLRCDGCRGVKQTAYRVEVYRVQDHNRHSPVLDTGLVTSSVPSHASKAPLQLDSDAPHFWKVQIWATVEGQGELEGTNSGTFRTALLDPKDWGDAQWMGGGTRFRGTFSLAPGKAVAVATAYVGSPGCYELSLNGRKAHPDSLLEPSWATLPARRVHYRAYDVKHLILEGGWNVAGIKVGMCKFNQMVGRCPGATGGWTSSCRAVLFQLSVRYQDGSELLFSSGDHASWSATVSADPIVYSDLFHGEIYDARLEDSVWDMPRSSRPEGHWEPAVSYHGSGHLGLPVLAEHPSITVTETLVPVAVRSVYSWETQSKEFIFDFGQNIAGFATLRVKNLPRGTGLRMRVGEALTSSGLVDRPFCPDEFNGDCRANQTDVYICRGATEETFTPHFTYHGFRYVQLGGLPDSYLPKDNTLIAHFAHSNLTSTGLVKFPNQDILNRIQRMILYTQLGNMHHHPEDCPHREKGGWLGDAQVTSAEASLNFDTGTFYKAFLEVMRDFQVYGAKGAQSLSALLQVSSDGWKPWIACDPLRPEFGCDYTGVSDKFLNHAGSLPDMVPYAQDIGGWPGDPTWTAAGVVIPRSLLIYRGEPVTPEAYALAKGVVDFFNGHGDAAAEGLVTYGYYGDWVEPVHTPTKQVTGFSHLLCLHYMVQLAEANGQADDVKWYSSILDRLKKVYHRLYWQPALGSYGHTHTANILPLYLDIPPPELRESVIAAFVKSLERTEYHLVAGLVGSAYVLQTLLKIGRGDLAFRMANLASSPSWGHMALAGPGTVWESFDTLFSGRSLNHPALAAGIGTFLYEMAGLRPEMGGNKVVFELDLAIATRLGSAEVSVTGLEGSSSFRWTLTGSLFALTANVPHGKEAVLCLPSFSNASNACEWRWSGSAWAPCRSLQLGADGSGARRILSLTSGVHEVRAVLTMSPELIEPSTSPRRPGSPTLASWLSELGHEKEHAGGHSRTPAVPKGRFPTPIVEEQAKAQTASTRSDASATFFNPLADAVSATNPGVGQSQSGSDLPLPSAGGALPNQSERTKQAPSPLPPAPAISQRTTLAPVVPRSTSASSTSAARQDSGATVTQPLFLASSAKPTPGSTDPPQHKLASSYFATALQAYPDLLPSDLDVPSDSGVPGGRRTSALSMPRASSPVAKEWVTRTVLGALVMLCALIVVAKRRMQTTLWSDVAHLLCSTQHNMRLFQY